MTTEQFLAGVFAGDSHQRHSDRDMMQRNCHCTDQETAVKT